MQGAVKQLQAMQEPLSKEKLLLLFSILRLPGLYPVCLTFGRKSDGDIKGAEMTKRRLSADLALTKAHLDIKKRDGKDWTVPHPCNSPTLTPRPSLNP